MTGLKEIQRVGRPRDLNIILCEAQLSWSANALLDFTIYNVALDGV